MNSDSEISSIDRQLLDLSKEYLGRVEAYAKDYQKAISLLDEARKSYEKSLLRKLLEIVKILSPFFAILLIFFLIQSQSCGTSIKGFGVEINKSCPAK